MEISFAVSLCDDISFYTRCEALHGLQFYAEKF